MRDLHPLRRTCDSEGPERSIAGQRSSALFFVRCRRLSKKALFAKARSAHPEVRLDEAAFWESLGVRELDDLLLADLYLAIACARGDRAAVQKLDALLRPLVGEAVGRALNKEPVFVEEVRQAMAERLLVGPRPRILDYEGKGPLTSWLRSTAVRTALNLQKAAKRDASLDDAVEAELSAPEDSPELQLLKQRCQKEFKGAFRAALDRLDEADRQLLRWNLVGKESIDALAERLGVSRATAARKLAAAKATLMELTQEQLRQRLRWSNRELHSVVGLVRSQLDLSLQRYLG